MYMVWKTGVLVLTALAMRAENISLVQVYLEMSHAAVQKLIAAHSGPQEDIAAQKYREIILRALTPKQAAIAYTNLKDYLLQQLADNKVIDQEKANVDVHEVNEAVIFWQAIDDDIDGLPDVTSIVRAILDKHELPPMGYQPYALRTVIATAVKEAKDFQDSQAKFYQKVLDLAFSENLGDLISLAAAHEELEKRWGITPSQGAGIQNFVGDLITVRTRLLQDPADILSNIAAQKQFSDAAERVKAKKALARMRSIVGDSVFKGKIDLLYEQVQDFLKKTNFFVRDRIVKLQKENMASHFSRDYDDLETAIRDMGNTNMLAQVKRAKDLVIPFDMGNRYAYESSIAKKMIELKVDKAELERGGALYEYIPDGWRNSIIGIFNAKDTPAKSK